MFVLDWIIVVYGAISLALFFRYLHILRRAQSYWALSEIEAESKDFIPSMIKDSLVWPYYVLWYGIKQFFEELK